MENWSVYRPIAPALRDLGLGCLGAGEQGGPLPSFRNRRLSSHAMVYISRGNGWLQHSGKLHQVQSPALIWIHPGVEHGYGPGPQGWTEHWVLFSGAGVRAFEELGCFSRTQPLVPMSGPDDQLLGTFKALHGSLRTEGPLADLQASIHTQQLIATAGRHSGAGRTGGKSEDTLRRLGEIAYQPLALPQQAALLGLSESQLRRHVQHAAGIGPKEFVLQMRISRSQSLLAESGHAVERIARLVGCEDPAYFSRLFSQRTGMSPSQFRREQGRVGNTDAVEGQVAPA